MQTELDASLCLFSLEPIMGLSFNYLFHIQYVDVLLYLFLLLFISLYMIGVVYYQYVLYVCKLRLGIGILEAAATV